MQLVDTKISGLKIFETRIFSDSRGRFIKTFNDDFFSKHFMSISIKETYYSTSSKDVVRGMHFQTPPFDHTKIVYVPYGKVIDVVLDIRKQSPTYGKYFSTELSAENSRILIIPSGLAHGFKSLEELTIVSYMQTSCYAPDNDTGVRFDSFGFDWGLEHPELSDRDKSFVPFSEYKTPF